jgi:hypothetical protein
VGRHGRRGPLVAGAVVRADTGGQQAGKRRWGRKGPEECGREWIGPGGFWNNDWEYILVGRRIWTEAVTTWKESNESSQLNQNQL